MDLCTTSGKTPLAPRWPVTTAGRHLLGGYAAGGYLLSLASVAYLAGFLADAGVPKGIDSGSPGSPVSALTIDGALLLIFTVQHSVMARPWFKDRSSRLVRPQAQRTTYVLATSVALMIMFWLWRPVPATVWLVRGLPGEALLVVYAAAVVFTIAATFQVSHTDLFGLRQAWRALTNRPYSEPQFTRTGLHRRLRHPITTGLLITVWATPHLTVGHLFLAACITGYIVIGTRWEEGDLITALGPVYAEYRRQVPAVLPFHIHRP